MSSNALRSPRGQAMLGYMPPFYQTSRVMKAVLQAQGGEVDSLLSALKGTLDQFFVRTATWDLDIWERELGLAPGEDLALSERRDRVISRLRGTGTCTFQVLKQVAESYDQGAVMAFQDHAAYTVYIRFVSTRGIPTNLPDLQTAVRAVVPAHLEIVYVFRYATWDSLDDRRLTWSDLDSLSLTWDELEVYTW